MLIGREESRIISFGDRNGEEALTTAVGSEVADEDVGFEVDDGDVGFEVADEDVNWKEGGV
jgi:hypothetical protein